MMKHDFQPLKIDQKLSLCSISFSMNGNATHPRAQANTLVPTYLIPLLVPP